MRMNVKKISAGLIFIILGALAAQATAQTRQPLFIEAATAADFQRAKCDGANVPVGKMPLYKVCAKPERLLKAALKAAKKADLPLLVVWGFDTCAICRRLEVTLTGSENQQAFSTHLFSYALSLQQQNAMEVKGVSQRIMLLRMNINTPQAGVLARREGLYDLAARMNRTKLWSPIMVFYNAKTRAWVSHSTYSGFEKPCRLGDEIVMALEGLGYVPKDSAKIVRMCKAL